MHVCVHVCVRAYLCVHMCMHVCVCVCVCICACVCVCTSVISLLLYLRCEIVFAIYLPLILRTISQVDLRVVLLMSLDTYCCQLARLFSRHAHLALPRAILKLLRFSEVIFVLKTVDPVCRKTAPRSGYVVKVRPDPGMP